MPGGRPVKLGLAAPVVRARLAGTRVAEQPLGSQAADQAAQARGQAGPLLSRERAQDPRLAGLPGAPDPDGDRAALRGQVQPDVPLIALVPAAADPALALKPGRKPAHGALLEPEQAGELALGDAASGNQLDEG